MPQLQIGELHQISQEEQMMKQFISDPNQNQNASQQLQYIGTQIIQKIEKQLQANKNMFDKNYEKINRVFNSQKNQIIEMNNEDEDLDISDLDVNDNYLSSRYAEYLKSNRKQPSGPIDSKLIQLPGTFKPGFNDNILQRKIRDFEEHGYGLINVLHQGQQMQTKSKNKFNEHIQNENNKRIFIDLQGNQVELQQSKINYQKDQNNGNMQNMYNNINNQQYMMQQQQYMLQGFNYPQASDENNQMIYNQVYAPIQQINVNQQYNILNVEQLKNQISTPMDQLYFNNQQNFINPIYNQQNIQFNNQIPIQMPNQYAYADNQIIINQQNVNSQLIQNQTPGEQELQGPQELLVKKVSNKAIISYEEQKEEHKLQSCSDKKSIAQKASLQCNSQQSGVMSKAGSQKDQKISQKQFNSSVSSQMSQKSSSQRRQQPFHEYKFSIAQQQDYIQEEEEFKQDKWN